MANLGSITMKSIPKDIGQSTITEMVSGGVSQEEIIEAVRSSTYEQFSIVFTDMQVS